MSGKGRAFCNYGQSSVWQYKGQNNRFVCGKHAVSKQGTRFTGMLGAKNGAPASTYTFLQVQHNKKWGTYQDSECSFEKNLCGFNAGAGKKRWTRATSTNSSKSGPKSAYHGKYFVYLSTKGGKKGDVSYLDYKAAAGESLGNVQMVQFYYHAYGSAMGMLQLEAQRDGKSLVFLPPSLVIPPPSLVNNPPSLVNNPPSGCLKRCTACSTTAWRGASRRSTRPRPKPRRTRSRCSAPKTVLWATASAPWARARRP